MIKIVEGSRGDSAGKDGITIVFTLQKEMWLSKKCRDG